MKKRFLFLALVMALLFTSVGVHEVAASARTTSWIVSVTYQNVGTDAADISVNFYQEGNATPITYNPGQLQAGAAGSFYMGSINDIAAGFQGNAVMSSSQPLVATVVQFHQNNPGEQIKMRMLSNGFTAADGASQYLVPTVLGNTFSRTTVFSVQNLENETISATMNFYNVSDGALASTKVFDIPANSSKYIEMDLTGDTGLPSAVFNGSVIVTAEKKTGGGPANVVAAASELYTNQDIGANFEGISLASAADVIYLPTALCQRFGLDTYYAVQNASLTSSATFTVSYYNADGSEMTTDGPYTIGPGQKQSITTCAPNSGESMTGFTGSAVIVAEDSTSTLVAIGKAQPMTPAPAAQKDFFTIFNGAPAGSSKIALPFVRWANDSRFNSPTNYGGFQRSYLAIQNLESTAAKVNVKYYDKNGGLVATQTLTIPGFAKANSDASVADALGKNGMNDGEFGYYTDGSFGGGVIIEAHPDNPTAEFIAIARVQHPGAGEDYNGMPIQ